MVRYWPVFAMFSVVALAGCGQPFGGAEASASASGALAPVLTSNGEVSSAVIAELRARRSVLRAGSSFAQVSEAILAHSQSAAESEVRVKRLTAKARSKNWLPDVGPQLSLRSLNEIVAGLVVDNALFDNGKRRFEREFAAADVESAAVALSVDLNQTVYDGLKLYLEAARAQALASLSQSGLQQFRDYERIVALRVEGGLSDRSEQRLLAQKSNLIETNATQERYLATAALAELRLLAGDGVTQVQGLGSVGQDPETLRPLSVLQAEANGSRTLAEVRVARAGMALGLGGALSLDTDGQLTPQVDVRGDVLSFGRGDLQAALRESEEMARRMVEEARRRSEQRLLGVKRDITNLEAQISQDRHTLAEMEANMELFQHQYKSGRRSLLELAGQFEDMLEIRKLQASRPYQIAQLELEIALLRGTLVSGGSM